GHRDDACHGSHRGIVATEETQGKHGREGHRRNTEETLAGRGSLLYSPCFFCVPPAGQKPRAESRKSDGSRYFLVSCSSSFLASGACGALGSAARNASRSALAS